MRLWKKKSDELAVKKAVREAVDSYPGGLCFSMLNGKPILVNARMNHLIGILTGKSVIEDSMVWSILENTESANGCKKPDMKYIGEIETIDENIILFEFPDKTIWQFQREVLESPERKIVQIKADDITEIYSMCTELYQNNIRLAELHKRQEALLSDIVQINREKELLNVKMKIHDEFGQCIIAAKKALTENTIEQNSAELINYWKDTVHSMKNISASKKETAPETELKKVADIIGCKVEINGKQPEDTNTLNMLYTAIREALTNAVRHAGADRLTVNISHSDNMCHAEISSNGKAENITVSEGGGLKNLRQHLEQEGAVLDIKCTNSVILNIDIPEC